MSISCAHIVDIRDDTAIPLDIEALCGLGGPSVYGTTSPILIFARARPALTQAGTQRARVVPRPGIAARLPRRLATSSSICFKKLAIRSGLYLLMGLPAVLLRVIFYHLRWHENPRSRQVLYPGKKAVSLDEPERWRRHA
jgi:hypothetical protein